MGARITLAGESLISQKLGTKQRLDVVRFVFANVPGLDPAAPIDRAAAKPPAEQIVYSYSIPQQNIGFVNPNQVVYSCMLGSDIGDFDWNWMGLETAEDVLLAVAYMPLQQKRKNIPPQQLGNNVTRNILVEFDGAQAVTEITIDASTWQHDFTVRLAGIDERERLSNRDIFGRACFYSESLQVEKNENGYHLKPGLAYIEGIRILLASALPIGTPTLPAPVWLHVSLRRELNEVLPSVKVVFDPNQVDYVDTDGTWHYCIPLAHLVDGNTITDLRTVEPIDGSLLQHLASVASVNQVQQNVDALVDGTTPAGKAKQLETPRQVSISGAGTGTVKFDGTGDVDIPLELANVIAPGVYTKVTVNANGLVVGAELLNQYDIPMLAWSTHLSGKPNTVEGYGITNALVVHKVSQQRPVLSAPLPGQNYWHGALEIREATEAGGTNTTFDYAPRMFFHWGSIVAGDLAMAASGELCWNGHRLWTQANFEPTTLVPTGAIIAFCHVNTFDGYLKANGAAVSRTAYARLFGYLGTHYGAGDGHSTFNLPDLRGVFLRGLDEGRGLDPGRGLGGFQATQNLWHDHSASSDVQGEHTHGILPISLNIATGLGAGHFSVGNTLSLNSGSAGSHAHNITVHGSGGNESRPPNIAMIYCIKY